MLVAVAVLSIIARAIHIAHWLSFTVQGGSVLLLHGAAFLCHCMQLRLRVDTGLVLPPHDSPVRLLLGNKTECSLQGLHREFGCCNLSCADLLGNVMSVVEMWQWMEQQLCQWKERQVCVCHCLN
jgi:hypothetical protein